MASTATSEISLLSKHLRNNIIQMEESVAKPVVSALIDELGKLRQPLSAAFQEDLLTLLYFGSMFDVKPQSDLGIMSLIKTHERECCISYDYATDLLHDEDLDLISQLSGLLISRPADSSLPIQPNAEVTYLDLRETLQKVVASEYPSQEQDDGTATSQEHSRPRYAKGERGTRVSEGPVLSLITKRLRTHRKKYTRDKEQDDGTATSQEHSRPRYAKGERGTRLMLFFTVIVPMVYMVIAFFFFFFWNTLLTSG